MRIEIQKDIPLPDRSGSGATQAKYVDRLREMKVGESALFSGCTKTEMVQVKNSAWRLKSKGQGAWVSRQVDTDSVRVWRTK